MQWKENSIKASSENVCSMVGEETISTFHRQLNLRMPDPGSATKNATCICKDVEIRGLLFRLQDHSRGLHKAKLSGVSWG